MAFSNSSLLDFSILSVILSILAFLIKNVPESVIINSAVSLPYFSCSLPFSKLTNSHLWLYSIKSLIKIEAFFRAFSTSCLSNLPFLKSSYLHWVQ